MEHPLPLDIFIIEDDADARENLRDILELDDHRVTVADCAARAFQSHDLSSAAVILLDWKLPDASALEVLPRLSAVAPEADVVIVTGYADFERAVSALRQGAADYLLKPINAEVLRASLRRLAQGRRLSQEKARSEDMFRTLVQAAPCLILILRRDLSVVYFSPYAEQVTGYSAQEIEGQSFAGLTLDGQSPDVIHQVVDELFRSGEADGRELEIACRDGSRRWLIWNARVLKDVEGQPAILAVGQDVTDQKHATERLVQSERLAAIGEAMTGLAHESRNALQRSQAFLELLATQLEGQPESLELVGRIQTAQNQLHQLYEEVRQYAAPLRISPTACEIDELIEETWAHLEHLRRNREARLQIHASARSATCPADRFMIQQVFRNVLENSLAACSGPVSIDVECAVVKHPDGPRLRVSVRDNGPGLSPEQRRRIFDPFYTTKTRGTGLGMTLSKRIVEAHGGTISVGEGPGTEIVLELPHQRLG